MAKLAAALKSGQAWAKKGSKCSKKTHDTSSPVLMFNETSAEECERRTLELRRLVKNIKQTDVRMSFSIKHSVIFSVTVDEIFDTHRHHDRVLTNWGRLFNASSSGAPPICQSDHTYRMEKDDPRFPEFLQLHQLKLEEEPRATPLNPFIFFFAMMRMEIAAALEKTRGDTPSAQFYELMKCFCRHYTHPMAILSDFSIAYFFGRTGTTVDNKHVMMKNGLRLYTSHTDGCMRQNQGKFNFSTRAIIAKADAIMEHIDHANIRRFLRDIRATLSTVFFASSMCRLLHIPTDVPGDGNCGYHVIAEQLQFAPSCAAFREKYAEPLLAPLHCMLRTWLVSAFPAYVLFVLQREQQWVTDGDQRSMFVDPLGKTIDGMGDLTAKELAELELASLEYPDLEAIYTRMYSRQQLRYMWSAHHKLPASRMYQWLHASDMPILAEILNACILLYTNDELPTPIFPYRMKDVDSDELNATYREMPNKILLRRVIGSEHFITPKSIF